MLLKIPQGQVSVDAKRGQVFLIMGTQVTDISGFGSGLNRFFTDHLAFEILRYFPDIPTDNHFTGIGLHGVYDSKYDRVLITKLDYVPKSDDVKYDAVNREFYVNKVYVQASPSTTTTSSTTFVGSTTSTTSSSTTTIKPITVREVVYLTDETYFCNKSWTVSFNFNTKSWISFHTYLPNWYIGENNFFYSGINGCCDDFDVIVGVPGPIPTTTSTTTAVPPSTTTTSSTSSTSSTTSTTSSSSTTTSTTTISSGIPPCERPDGLIQTAFYTGYDIVSPPSNVVSTGSSSDVCDAIAYLEANSSGAEYVNVIPTYILVEYQGLYLNSEVYIFNGTTDCEAAPDGWYFVGGSDVAIHVEGGQITEIVPCTTTTTTTSSSSTTSTTSSSSSTTTTTTTGGS